MKRLFAVFMSAAPVLSAQVDYDYALAAAKTMESQRERLQRASEILSALQVGQGDVVADVGAGPGYYTARLSSIVGPNGRVYAIDVGDGPLNILRRRVVADQLFNVIVRRGVPDDPRLPLAGLNAVLIVRCLP